MPTQQERYYESLLARVRAEKYPSNQLMNRLEDMFMSSDQMLEYLEVLFEKVNSTRYPSPQLLDRIERLLLVVARA